MDDLGGAVDGDVAVAAEGHADARVLPNLVGGVRVGGEHRPHDVVVVDVEDVRGAGDEHLVTQRGEHSGALLAEQLDDFCKGLLFGHGDPCHGAG